MHTFGATFVMHQVIICVADYPLHLSFHHVLIPCATSPVQIMPQTYLLQRSDLVQLLYAAAPQLVIAREVAHDAVLLMDKVMSTGHQLMGDPTGQILATACLVIVAQQVRLKQRCIKAEGRRWSDFVNLEAMSGGVVTGLKLCITTADGPVHVCSCT